MIGAALGFLRSKLAFRAQFVRFLNQIRYLDLGGAGGGAGTRFWKPAKTHVGSVDLELNLVDFGPRSDIWIWEGAAGGAETRWGDPGDESTTASSTAPSSSLAS